jgi:hypothetical protein
MAGIRNATGRFSLAGFGHWKRTRSMMRRRALRNRRIVCVKGTSMIQLKLTVDLRVLPSMLGGSTSGGCMQRWAAKELAVSPSACDDLTRAVITGGDPSTFLLEEVDAKD